MTDQSRKDMIAAIVSSYAARPDSTKPDFQGVVLCDYHMPGLETRASD